VSPSTHGDGGVARRRRAAAAVRAVTGVEVAVASVTVVVIFVLVLVQALQRYLPVSGWAWTGELSTFCLVWLTFTVAGVLVTSDSHISLQLVDSLTNPLVTRVVRTFSCAVVAVVGAAFAAEALSSIEDEMLLESPALQMPMGYLYVLPFLGFLSTSVRAAAMAVVFAVRGVPPEPSPVAPAEDGDEGVTRA
jgi:TRAP-type transport system small permease protein